MLRGLMDPTIEAGGGGYPLPFSIQAAIMLASIKRRSDSKDAAKRRVLAKRTSHEEQHPVADPIAEVLGLLASAVSPATHQTSA